MSLDELLVAARAVGEGPSEEWAFRAMDFGERLESELAHPDRLTEVSRQLVDIAARSNCEQVLGASAVGERLAAAAVALAGNGLRLFANGTPGERVLIVDGTLATGTQITKAIRQARAAGAQYTPAAVVVALAGAERSVDEADDLSVVYG